MTTTRTIGPRIGRIGGVGRIGRLGFGALSALLLAGCAHAKQAAQKNEEARTGQQVSAPRPVGTTPQSIVTESGTRRLQRALGVEQTGQLDDATRQALERFQRRHALAATGLPDLETVKQLGLDPDDVFRTGSRSREGDRRAKR